MSRLQAILKLAQQVLTEPERNDLNSALVSAKGFDLIKDILGRYGFSLGREFAKGKYYLERNGLIVGNAFLVGDYQRMQIAMKKTTKRVEKKKKRPIPWDAKYSPAEFYAQQEREQENEEDDNQ